MFLDLLANASEMVNGTYPGGASADDPVPTNVAYYGMSGSTWRLLSLCSALRCSRSAA